MLISKCLIGKVEKKREKARQKDFTPEENRDAM